jgi:SAM-dependent methyltransferase
MIEVVPDANDAHIAANRALWEKWTPHHVRSAFYDVAGFKAGADPLDRLVSETLGDVAGQSVLHLQCHFGLDSLSLARRGAVVTGVDFSTEAIAVARNLAAETGLAARFVESDIYKLPEKLNGAFDVVFTSNGVLCWLPDLAEWARIVAHFLKPGGRLCLVDEHPFAMIFDPSRTDGELALRERYFHGDQPLVEEVTGSYAGNIPVSGVEHTWLHTVEDILQSLLAAGLRIETFREYPLLAWRFLPGMERAEPGLWKLSGDHGWLPLTLAVTARK